MPGTSANAKLPLALGGVLLFVFAATLFTSPEGKLNWLLEVGPGLVGMVALAATYKRFPVTPSGIVVVPAGAFPARKAASPFLASIDESARLGEAVPRMEVLA